MSSYLPRKWGTKAQSPGEQGLMPREISGTWFHFIYFCNCLPSIAYHIDFPFTSGIKFPFKITSLKIWVCLKANVKKIVVQVVGDQTGNQKSLRYFRKPWLQFPLCPGCWKDQSLIYWSLTSRSSSFPAPWISPSVLTPGSLSSISFLKFPSALFSSTTCCGGGGGWEWQRTQ